MNEFEKELINKIDPYDRTLNGNKLFLGGVLAVHFKDWQPPKPLVVVPQIVADFIEVRKKSLKLHGAFREIEECYGAELYNWVFQKRNGQDLFARAWLDGYTVEKVKKYLLKHIDFCKTDKHYDWFTIKHSDGPLNHLRVEKGEKPSTIDCKFTQEEIDKLHIGSYEQKEVEP